MLSATLDRNRRRGAIDDFATHLVTLKLAKPLARGPEAQLVIHGRLDASGKPLDGGFSAIVRGLVLAMKRGHAK